MIDTLINRARPPFIFATAPAPLTAALVRAALRALQSDPSLQAAAQARVAHAHAEAKAQLGGLAGGLDSQIIPVILGDDERTMATAKALQSRGFDVRGIRPPTVPRGTSRLRISITGNVSHADISSLFAAISDIQQEQP